MSQYLYEKELLYPACTYLTCEGENAPLPSDNTRYLYVRAGVDNARHNEDNIRLLMTVKNFEISTKFSTQKNPAYSTTKLDSKNNFPIWIKLHYREMRESAEFEELDAHNPQPFNADIYTYKKNGWGFMLY